MVAVVTNEGSKIAGKLRGRTRPAQCACSRSRTEPNTSPTPEDATLMLRPILVPQRYAAVPLPGARKRSMALRRSSAIFCPGISLVHRVQGNHMNRCSIPAGGSKTSRQRRDKPTGCQLTMPSTHARPKRLTYGSRSTKNYGNPRPEPLATPDSQLDVTPHPHGTKMVPAEASIAPQCRRASWHPSDYTPQQGILLLG